MLPFYIPPFAAAPQTEPQEDTMPAFLAPLISGGLGLLGGILGNRSANQGYEAQERMGQQALDWQKQQDAMNRAAWAQAMDEYNARRAVLMQRYGISVDTPGAGGAPGEAPQYAPRASGADLGMMAARGAPRMPYRQEV